MNQITTFVDAKPVQGSVPFPGLLTRPYLIQFTNYAAHIELEIGDGKIFVLDLQDCIRIRTGERGGLAIG